MFGRLIQPPLRDESLALLRVQGLATLSVNEAGGRTFVRLGRWLVRRDCVAQSLAAGLTRKRDLLRARTYRLVAIDGRPEPELVMVRQLHRPKVSVFRLAEGSKEVATRHAFDFDNEMSADREFRAIGMRCPELQSADRARLCYRQALVRDPLRRTPPVASATTDEILRELSRRSNFDRVPSARYLAEATDALITLGFSLGTASVEMLRQPLELLTDRGRKPDLLPLALSHGDFSAGNLLYGDDGSVFLNDFDRALQGTAFYDCAYLATVDGRPKEWLDRELSAVAARHEVAVPDAAGARSAFVTALLVMDLLRYAAKRYRSIDHADDRLCRYSVDLAQRVTSAHEWRTA